ncbi:MULTISPECIES: intradiol ring-cleavage dioxygenase [unclassified Streptomyces]|uniref:dioxygenase family protein n=1 Tax=unclassified Streptomyces TaxID=2593676 RepID=UPI002255AEBE|nr:MULTISPECIES: intradiol ring-cleavage dioxygenase [unclassified Streptomyces]MCX4529583.1 intradiol ring-cleavage dioxygenase [Streptomyces sp. NBC_01551]MCX4539844.1 intradiol ring-cleavage dioxygenase [Streptomyces sp. NBC_01565]
MSENGSSPAPTSRRTLLLAAGSAGVAALAAACAGPAATRGAAAPTATPSPPRSPGAATPTPACVLATEAGAGPYYLDLDRVRSDITEGRRGVPFRLDLTVVRVPVGCRPLANAAVDVWHADPSGTYSTGGATFLRGTQVTDAAGRCSFLTIVPGWYAGLAPHIHFKVRPDSRAESVSQFFFPEDLLVKVYARPPYDDRRAPEHPNARDSRYRASGATMTLAPVPDGTGYRAAYTVGIA